MPGSLLAMVRRLVVQARSCDLAAMHRLVESGRLDEHYVALVRAVGWVDRVAQLVEDGGELQAARLELARTRDGVLRFFQVYFQTHHLIGDPAAVSDPALILVLACKEDAELAMRVVAAIPLMERHPAATVVLCGGGFHPGLTEAEKMQRQVLAAGVAEGRLVLEQDSVDTVANAVFAKLRLRQEGRLPADGGVVVVTSAFHAVRSLNLVRRVFGPSYRVAAVPARGEVERDARAAAHELESDSQSSRDIFAVEDPFAARFEEVEAGDERSMLLQLVLHHAFYRHRFDLLRSFADVLATEPVSQPADSEGDGSVMLRFVPLGSDLKGKLGRDEVAVDVGSGEPHEGIFDHHHRPAGVGSAAELVWRRRELVSARLEGVERPRLVCHADPDLDCVVSCFLAASLARTSGHLDEGQMERLVRFVSSVDQGRVDEVSDLSLYTLILSYGSWRRGPEGERLLGAPGSAGGPLDALLWWGAIPTGGVDFEVVRLGCATLHALLRGGIDPAAPLAPGLLGPELEPALSSLRDYVAEQWGGCRAELERARTNGWLGRLQVLGDGGRAVETVVVRVVDPRPSGSVLVRFLRRTVLAEEGRHPVTVIQSTLDTRTVVSVAPDCGLNLRGLGLHLDRLERAR